MYLLMLNLFLGSAGLTVMLLATYRFHKLIKHTREATYQTQKSNVRAEVFPLLLMYVFVVCYAVGVGMTMYKYADPIHSFVLVIFFMGSVFIHFTINSQISMTMLLREKNMEIMKTFVNAIDLKDSYTKGHSEHVYDLVAIIYDYLPEHCQQRLNKPKLLDAAMLHDCGKISIRDDILNKRGRLTKDDWEAIKGHAIMGKRMLDDTCFSDISDWVLYHHERVDGKGYYGLSGTEIPLESRIIAIADTYSALSTDRIYRKRYSHEQAIEIMALCTGSQLDIELMGCFMRIPFRDLEKVRPADSIIFPETPEGADAKTESAGKDAIRSGSTFYLH